MFSTDYDNAIFFFTKTPFDIAVSRFLSVFNGSQNDVVVENGKAKALGYEVGSVGEWTVFANYAPQDEWYYLDEPSELLNMAQNTDAVYASYDTDRCSGILMVERWNLY